MQSSTIPVACIIMMEQFETQNPTTSSSHCQATTPDQQEAIPDREMDIMKSHSLLPEEEDSTDSTSLASFSSSLSGSFSSLSSLKSVPIAKSSLYLLSSPRSSTRKVKFDPNVETIGTSATYKKHNTWYSAREYKEIKMNYTKQVRRLVRGKKSQYRTCCSVLSDFFDDECKHSSNEQKTTTTEAQDMTLMRNAQHEKLTEMYSHFEEEEGDILAGLECSIVRYRLHDGRKRRLRMLMDTMWQFEAPFIDEDSDPELVAEEFRERCEEITRPSRLFAQRIAQARFEAS